MLAEKDYNSKIINNKIMKIFNLEDFKLYFKLDPKPLKVKDNNVLDKNTSGKKRKKENKNINNINFPLNEEKDDSLSSSETKSEYTELSLSSSSKISMTTVKNLNTKDINIFANNLITELDSRDEFEIMDGHDYENQTKKYFEIFLDFCSERKLKIGNCPTQKITFIYKKYDELLKNNKNLKKMKI